MLRNDIPNPHADREEMLQEVQAMASHIGRLENYVAAMSRLQRLEDVEIHAEPVRAEAFVQSMRDSAQILASGKKVAFEVDAGEEWRVDAEVVMQVYENLLANAARYAKAQLVVRIVERHGVLGISVADDGTGFTPIDLKKATEPFYRAEGSGDTHLGLGLNICRIHCERHGGGVTVRNGEHGGIADAWFAMRSIN
jgi:signal transduction histidine kinase